MTVYELKKWSERGRSNARRGSASREETKLHRLWQDRQVRKTELARLRRELEHKIGILYGNMAWEELAPRLHANDPDNPAKATYWAIHNNRVSVQMQEDEVATLAEYLRAKMKEVIGDKYKLREERGMELPLVDRAKWFMELLEKACRDMYHVERAALMKEKDGGLRERKDSVLETVNDPRIARHAVVVSSRDS